MFFGALIAILLSILHHFELSLPSKWGWILLYVTVGLYIASGIIYFIGGCALASAYNASGVYDSSYAGIWFAESFYIGSHAIIAGSIKLRVMFHALLTLNTMHVFCVYSEHIHRDATNLIFMSCICLIFHQVWIYGSNGWIVKV